MQSGCTIVDRHVAPFISCTPTSIAVPSEWQSPKLVLPLSEKCHAGHGTHVASLVAAVAFEYFPKPQSSQTDLETAPKTCAYFPAAHSSHVELPLAVENVPLAHGTHKSGVSVLPKGHVEHSGREAAAEKGSIFPGVQATQDPWARGHVLQFEAPRSCEYFPTSQSRHACSDVAPSCIEYLLAAQSLHAVSEEAPDSDEYLPIWHLVQVAEELAPTVVEYLPATSLAAL